MHCRSVREGNFRSGRGFLIENLKNLLDDHYELAWRYPQPGRSFYLKTRARF